MTGFTSISTYHEYIFEAISSLCQGLALFEKAKEIPEDVASDPTPLFAEMCSRYSFLMIANSLEASANALLLSLKLDDNYYEELERMSTLVKFKIFCDFNGKRLSQGDVKFARVKDIINCRNEFVHPKPKKVGYSVDQSTSRINFEVKKQRLSALFQ